MNEIDKAEFCIEVSTTDATHQELDGKTRQLPSGLRGLEVRSAMLAKGRAAEFVGAPEELQKLLEKLKRGEKKN